MMAVYRRLSVPDPKRLAQDSSLSAQDSSLSAADSSLRCWIRVYRLRDPSLEIPVYWRQIRVYQVRVLVRVYRRDVGRAGANAGLGSWTRDYTRRASPS